MAWVKLDDRFSQHPKVLSIGHIAFRLYINSLCYSSLYQTDGKLTGSVCSNLLANAYHVGIDEGHPDEFIDELVTAGLWEKHDGFYMIHDFLDYNFSKEQREEISQLRAEAGQKGGKAKRKQTAKQLLSKSEANSKQKSAQTPSPSQSQSPSQLQSTKNSDNTSPPSEEQWPSPKLLIAKYNKEAPDECPAVKTVSPARIRKAKSYLDAFPSEEWWSAVFAQMCHSRFLRGLTQPTNGHGSFVADFDWLLTKGKDGSENAAKVHDGRYH